MTCNYFTHHLNDYIDNGLDPAVMMEMTDHMEQCQQCRIEFETLSSMLMMINNLDESLEYPEDLHQSIMTKIESTDEFKTNEKPRKITKIPIRMFSTIAASFIIVVTLIAMSRIGMMKKESVFETDSVSYDMATAESTTMEMAPLESSGTMDTARSIQAVVPEVAATETSAEEAPVMMSMAEPETNDVQMAEESVTESTTAMKMDTQDEESYDVDNSSTADIAQDEITDLEESLIVEESLIMEEKSVGTQMQDETMLENKEKSEEVPNQMTKWLIGIGVSAMMLLIGSITFISIRKK